MKNLVIRSGSLRMGGLERVLIEMLQNLDRKKYKISLIIQDDSGEENFFLNEVPKEIEIYFLKSEELIKRIHYHRQRKGKLYNKIIYNFLMMKEHSFVLARTKEVLKEIKSKNGEIDVFLDYDWGARRYVEKLDVKRKLVWVHNSVPNLLKKKSKIQRLGKYLKKYDSVVAICDEMKEELKEIYPYLKDKVCRIYNPFNFKRIIDESTRDDLLTEEERDLLRDDYIIAVSRLDTNQKDYKTLLLGYKKYLESSQGIEKLYIVGGGPSENEIRDMIREFKLESRVYLLGMKKNPYIWMKNSKAFVHSSKYEGFGLVLVEAAALGKTIISSDCKVGPKEILGYGKYGKLFEVGDIEGLSNSLNLILSDRLLRESFERLVKKRSEDFDIKKIIKQYENLIDNRDMSEINE